VWERDRGERGKRGERGRGREIGIRVRLKRYDIKLAQWGEKVKKKRSKKVNEFSKTEMMIW
jgi:hypothetical protein